MPSFDAPLNRNPRTQLRARSAAAVRPRDVIRLTSSRTVDLNAFSWLPSSHTSEPMTVTAKTRLQNAKRKAEEANRVFEQQKQVKEENKSGIHAPQPDGLLDMMSPLQVPELDGLKRTDKVEDGHTVEASAARRAESLIHQVSSLLQQQQGDSDNSTTASMNQVLGDEDFQQSELKNKKHDRQRNRGVGNFETFESKSGFDSTSFTPMDPTYFNETIEDVISPLDETEAQTLEGTTDGNGTNRNDVLNRGRAMFLSWWRKANTESKDFNYHLVWVRSVYEQLKNSTKELDKPHLYRVLTCTSLLISTLDVLVPQGEAQDLVFTLLDEVLACVFEDFPSLAMSVVSDLKDDPVVAKHKVQNVHELSKSYLASSRRAGHSSSGVTKEKDSGLNPSSLGGQSLRVVKSENSVHYDRKHWYRGGATAMTVDTSAVLNATSSTTDREQDKDNPLQEDDVGVPFSLLVAKTRRMDLLGRNRLFCEATKVEKLKRERAVADCVADLADTARVQAARESAVVEHLKRAELTTKSLVFSVWKNDTWTTKMKRAGATRIINAMARQQSASLIKLSWLAFKYNAVCGRTHRAEDISGDKVREWRESESKFLQEISALKAKIASNIAEHKLDVDKLEESHWMQQHQLLDDTKDLRESAEVNKKEIDSLCQERENLRENRARWRRLTHCLLGESSPYARHHPGQDLLFSINQEGHAIQISPYNDLSQVVCAPMAANKVLLLFANSLLRLHSRTSARPKVENLGLDLSDCEVYFCALITLFPHRLTDAAFSITGNAPRAQEVCRVLSEVGFGTLVVPVDIVLGVVLRNLSLLSTLFRLFASLDRTGTALRDGIPVIRTIQETVVEDDSEDPGEEGGGFKGPGRNYSTDTSIEALSKISRFLDVENVDQAEDLVAALVKENRAWSYLSEFVQRDCIQKIQSVRNEGEVLDERQRRNMEWFLSFDEEKIQRKLLATNPSNTGNEQDKITAVLGAAGFSLLSIYFGYAAQEPGARMSQQGLLKWYQDLALSVGGSGNSGPLEDAYRFATARMELLSEERENSPTGGTLVKGYIFAPTAVGANKRKLTQAMQSAQVSPRIFIEVVIHLSTFKFVMKGKRVKLPPGSGTGVKTIKTSDPSPGMDPLANTLTGGDGGDQESAAGDAGLALSPDPNSTTTTTMLSPGDGGITKPISIPFDAPPHHLALRKFIDEEVLPKSHGSTDIQRVKVSSHHVLVQNIYKRYQKQLMKAYKQYTSRHINGRSLAEIVDANGKPGGGGLATTGPLATANSVAQLLKHLPLDQLVMTQEDCFTLFRDFRMVDARLTSGEIYSIFLQISNDTERLFSVCQDSPSEMEDLKPVGLGYSDWLDCLTIVSIIRHPNPLITVPTKVDLLFKESFAQRLKENVGN